MDNSSIPIPSTPPHPATQLAVSSPAESPNRRWLLWLVGGLAVLVLGIAIGIFGAKFFSQFTTQPQISTYQDCLAAKGSIVQETYPATCVTVSGQRFVQPLTDKEKQGLQPPDLYREPTSSAATSDWKEFKDDESGTKFKHPVNWTIDPQKQTQNVIVALDNGGKGVFTFQRAPQGIGLECAKIITEETAYLNEIKVNKTITQTTTGDECGNSDSRETIWINFDKNSVKYLVTYHYLGTNDNQERQLFDQILSTFKFPTDSSSQPIVSTPLANAKITSPLIIKGIVPRGWTFEGVFPIKLVDANKKLIVQSQGKEITPGLWSSGEAIEFSATLTFTTASKSGFIFLEKDNPSGLSENNMFLEIPVDF